MVNADLWEKAGIPLPSDAVGPEVYVTCPWCSHERKNKRAKCLSANVEKLTFCCHHCGRAGSVANGNRDKLTPGWRKPQFRRPEPRKASTLPAHVVEWFASRSIPVDVLTKARISWVNVYMPQIEERADAIAFPYYRDKQLINRKYRTLDKQFRMDTGAERVLYNLDSIGETVVIVEGEMDALSCMAAGIESVVSVPDGAPAADSRDYSSKFTFLDADAKKLDPVKRFVIAVDNDAPGKRLDDELARRLGRERCWQVEWPAGCKDANDVLVKHGAEDLRWFIEHATPYPIDGVFTSLGDEPKVFVLHRNGFERGHSTGWPSLDKLYTVRPGEFTVVLGVPGSGKSNWLDALLVNLARLHGWPAAMFSPENQPIEDHMARFAEKYTGLPFYDGPTPRMTESDLHVALEWMDGRFFWLLPHAEASWDITWILARAKELVVRAGIRVLVIDPWNEIEPQRDKNESETEYVSRVLRTVRQFARQHGVHVFIAVHPTKLYRDKEGKYPIPNLYDAMGSAHWRNKADNGLCLWRNFEDPASRELDVHVQKVRFRQIGRIGKTTLLYDPVTANYRDQNEEVPCDARLFGENT